MMMVVVIIITMTAMAIIIGSGSIGSTINIVAADDDRH
jgi:hypothetical protein